jgi:hypothetical protein
MKNVTWKVLNLSHVSLIDADDHLQTQLSAALLFLKQFILEVRHGVAVPGKGKCRANR